MSAVAEKPAPAAKKKYRFKLLKGVHAEGVGPKTEVDPETGKKRPVVRPVKIYKEGEIIETDTDLSKQNPKDKKGNVVQEMMKFAKVYEDGSTEFSGPLTPARSDMDQRDDESDSDYETRILGVLAAKKQKNQDVNDKMDSLASLSIAALREYAAREEIDLGNATKKDDLLKVINDALKGK